MSDNQTQESSLALERLFLKDVSFEVPNHLVFTKKWEPEVDVKLTSFAEQVADAYFEVSLKVVVETKLEGEIAYIADVTQSGIFFVDNVPEERIPYILGAYIPNILFPFLRQEVCDLITKGSFPQFLLTPVDFDTEFQIGMQRALAEQEANNQPA